MQRPVAFAAPIAAVICAAAAIGFGAQFEEFSHLQHPLGLLGATRVPRASAFNAIAFVVPGVLAMVPAVVLRGRLADAGWTARIGAQALLLSAVAFTAQGLLPLDSTDLDGGGSRLHSAAWTAWWLAFAVGAAMLVAERRRAQGQAVKAIAGCAVATLLLALIAPLVIPAGIAQRLAFAAWFLAMWLAGRRQP